MENTREVVVEKRQTQPPSNGKPTGTNAAGWFTRLFDAGNSKLLHLSANDLKALYTPLTPIPFNLEALRPHASDEPAAADAFAARLGESEFDSDPTRNERRDAALAIAAAVEQRSAVVSASRAEAIASRDGIEQYHYVPSDDLSRVLTVGNIPNLITLLFWVAIFIGAVIAEIKNAVFLVMSSELEFQDDPVGATCFSIVYVLAPLAIFKFAHSELRIRARRRFNSITITLGLPTAVFGIVLFAWKIGNMQEDIDLFNPETGGFDPPFWAVMATAMLLLAFCVMIIPLFIRSSIRQSLCYEVRENPVFTEASKRVSEYDEVLTELEALRVSMDGIVRCLDAEQKRHVAECMSALRRCRNQFLARKSSLFAE